MLVIADRCGGLCNRLWTFANVVAWGLEHDRSAVSLGFDDAGTRFPALTTRLGVSGWLSPDEPIARLTRVAPRALWRLAFRVNLRAGTVLHLALRDHESLDLESPQIGRKLESANLTFMTGLYHLAPRSLAKHADRIRRLFQPDGETKRRAERTLAEARTEAELVIGVHIRQGDYRTFCDGLMFYSTEEYAELMRHLTSLWPDRAVSFVVCSGEEQPAEAFEGVQAFHGPGDRFGDLHALALCDYIVGPSSTFSRWASFWGRTPLWMMDWKAAERSGSEVFRTPAISDFEISQSASHLIDRGALRERGAE